MTRLLHDWLAVGEIESGPVFSSRAPGRAYAGRGDLLHRSARPSYRRAPRPKPASTGRVSPGTRARVGAAQSLAAAGAGLVEMQACRADGQARQCRRTTRGGSLPAVAPSPSCDIREGRATSTRQAARALAGGVDRGAYGTGKAGPSGADFAARHGRCHTRHGYHRADGICCERHGGQTPHLQGADCR